MSATATDYTYAIYIWQSSSFGEEWIGPICCMICICMIELNFEEQIENKLEVNSNRINVNRNTTQIQLVVTSLSEIEILRSTDC
jgi:hypothetical protein